ncbi:erythromycin esterase family protein, partial [Cesiribacter andamanensis]|uniref:erythromycin esterase family protein n=1 Tax=Cesiribacter andamanensis TaxID=649507 RepID=UPI00058B1122
METQPFAAHAHPLHSPADLDALLKELEGARIIMLGEATHGTHEFYTWRMEISRRLLAEKGFNFIAVEGDWPDCYRINRYVKGYPGSGRSAREVIGQFERWPGWMWANWEMAAFARWLRQYNQAQPAPQKAGFYGLDVYSLWESLEAILEYLQQQDPEAAALARKSLHCLEPYRDEEGGIAYARAQRWMPRSCEKEVLALLSGLRSRSSQYRHDPEGAFNAEQNA